MVTTMLADERLVVVEDAEEDMKEPEIVCSVGLKTTQEAAPHAD